MILDTTVAYLQLDRKESGRGQSGVSNEVDIRLFPEFNIHAENRSTLMADKPPNPRLLPGGYDFWLYNTPSNV
jgi:hypothetical protein